MIVEGRVGPSTQSDGSLNPIRLGKTGEQIVQQAHTGLYEAVSRGNVYVACSQTGQTTAAGLSATPGTLALYNPAGSGVNLILLRAGAVFSVAFAAAAVIWLGLNTNNAAAAVTGTTATTRNLLLGPAAINQSGKALAFTAPTLPAVPVAGALLGVGLTGAITTAPTGQVLDRYFEGGIIIPPGCAVSFQTSTASGASAFFGELVWEEVPIV